MISTIEVCGPATFKDRATLSTNKKINLVYGLNGSGKSTVCRFLRSPSAPEFDACRILPQVSSTIYVYNEDFIRENFYESETLKGIFSLSKENKDAELKINNAKSKRATHLQEKDEASLKRVSMIENTRKAKQQAEDATWEIKTKFAGGDRVLEYCLEGLKGKKETLFDHLSATPKPDSEPTYSADDLKLEANSLSDDNALPAIEIPRVDLDLSAVELDEALKTAIIGSEHSAVAALIQELGNSDWVKQGLVFTTPPGDQETINCPFCQSETITNELLNEIARFFDDSYQTAILHVERQLENYRDSTTKIPGLDGLRNNSYATEKLIIAVQELKAQAANNLAKIEKKILNPSTHMELYDSSAMVLTINKEIDYINKKITSYNEKLNKKDETLRSIKKKFWSLMRWDYDIPLSHYSKTTRSIKSNIKDIDANLAQLEELIKNCNSEISQAQKETVNIDEAVENINGALLELGIEDFSICKHSDALYRMQRINSNEGNHFNTLSEGEKMIITLLYFCELCKGRESASDTASEKIVVLDDPVSSLSHIYVFNVGQLIRSLFFSTDLAQQVFVFTHSLYFFYELTDPKHERRELNQALFRISKRQGQTSVEPMKYEEIQNDYQAYWQVVNDKTQHPALVANCMRNIIEYFFNFVVKNDFNNVFQRPELRENRFQAFSRYMNRESHSLGQNLHDLKEFDYDSFRDGLHLVFDRLGYLEHYKRMTKL